MSIKLSKLGIRSRSVSMDWFSALASKTLFTELSFLTVIIVGWINTSSWSSFAFSICPAFNSFLMSWTTWFCSWIGILRLLCVIFASSFIVALISYFFTRQYLLNKFGDFPSNCWASGLCWFSDLSRKHCYFSQAVYLLHTHRLLLAAWFCSSEQQTYGVPR